MYYLCRFVLLSLPSDRKISPVRCSSIKVKVKACLHVCVCLECTIWSLLHVPCHMCIVFKCHLLHSFCSFTSVIWLHGFVYIYRNIMSIDNHSWLWYGFLACGTSPIPSVHCANKTSFYCSYFIISYSQYVPSILHCPSGV